jgi:high frequency lysogenization protein
MPERATGGYDDRDRTLALAGVFQSAWLVHARAFGGEADQAAVAATLGSLYRFDAPSTAEVFGGVAAVRVGLRSLRASLGGRLDSDLEHVMRYTLGLLHLERLAVADTALVERIRQGCVRAASQSEHLGALHESVYASLAETWTRTIGTLTPKIIVNGAPGRLQDPRVAAEVRALLLGGLRAAVLWRQVGGSRWALVFRRGALRATADRLLEA